MRVNKQSNKLFVYLSLDLINALNLTENDELEFLPFNNKSFLVAKKADLATLLISNEKQQSQKQEATEQSTVQSVSPKKLSISEEEIFVLKKLDEIRYNTRTVENVEKILNPKYHPVLQRLIKAKIVNLFKDKNGIEVYSISKYVYDNFLMRKKLPEQSQNKVITSQKPIQTRNINAQFFYKKPPEPELINDEVTELDKNGFVVLQTEAEAANISFLLEDSIKHGMVLGTRAFNKKFYIITRAFFEKHSSNLVKLLRESPMKVPDLANSEKINEEAVRGIMYLLAEAGDAKEQRRDLFALA